MATNEETHNRALEGLECLKRAVRKELEKKALLGQYVIINRDGKACRISAKEALKMTDNK